MNSVFDYLVKAINDPFDYFLRTKSGCNFRFEYAEVVSKNTILIKGIKELSIPGLEKMTETSMYVNFERGVQIDISEIEFVVDAPIGS